MSFFIGLRNAIVPSLLLWALGIYGCASFGQFSTQGASVATNVVNVAQALLHDLDKCYGDLLRLKGIPDYTTEATRALSIADAAAGTLKAVIAGATVTDEQLNVAAGQAQGANAMLAQLTDPAK